MRRWTAAILWAGLSLGEAAAVETEAGRWNLADLYPSSEAWQADPDKLAAQS